MKQVLQALRLDRDDSSDMTMLEAEPVIARVTMIATRADKMRAPTSKQIFQLHILEDEEYLIDDISAALLVLDTLCLVLSRGVDSVAVAAAG